MPPPSPSRDELFELYKIAIDEYRFEVKLNWDRTVYYLTLNSGLIAIATGLLKISSTPIVGLLVAAIFLIGLCCAIIGCWAIWMGHRYYHRTILKKTLLEDRLGLTQRLDDYPSRPTLAIGTTTGQNDPAEILYKTDEYLNRKLRPPAISFWVLAILVFFGGLDLAGIGVSVWFSTQVPAQEIKL